MAGTPSERGIITHINISEGGVPKNSIPVAIVRQNGIEGDRQKNLKYHGGPDRAVCLWSAEIITRLQREGHPINPGSTGENVTISGLDWAILRPQNILSLGHQVQLQITDYAAPCRTIAKSFKLRRYSQISQKRHPGISRLYASVLTPGTIQVGDPVTVLPRRPAL